MPCLQITWAKPGRGVSCLSRAPGMSVCLGTKRKCLWSIWAGRGQGAVYLLEGVCVCVCVCVCRGQWYLLGLLGDVKERGEQSSLLSEELERSIQTFRTA